MNKFYIKIVFFLLTTPLCVNNKTIVIELSLKKDTKPKSTNLYPTNDSSEEVYEKNIHLLCNDPKETKNACNVMKEALIQLEYHTTNIVDYGLYKIYYTDYVRFDNVKYQYNTNVEKKQYIVDNPDMYNKIINKYWDPDSDHFLYIGSVKRKIARVYTPNLVIIQQRSRKWPWSREKYFYALAAKFEISENKTIIVMTSANINDHNPSNEKYENEIVKSANLFKTDINSEDDIRKGYLKKTFVNIAGYIIEKKDKYLDVTHVESIDRYAPSFLKRMIRKALNNFSPQK
ncbi:fam-a protein [Plasmodium yoelii]|uniref:Fam-a protein n=2 Tax=Plasmodium yoelii TaxID=5861 RepID=A0AAE9WLD1_PLAYO|nr:fam-a protein [Plasmodium yoelii]WBY55840.1 fam-a protein [Plasmodium yoelii yoelii]VTZ75050.1 fam-a protein [Plasmodium yoelii]|eukprot:XP_034493413.1 fam-a protein [Plasmodium yoelii]